MSKMLDQLGVPEDQRNFVALDNPLPGGIALPAPQGVFPRWVEETAGKP
jgi:methionyl-tRNA synthetase